jgi:hypothetical protein
MNKEKQRIAIAEACGWTDVKGTKGVHPKARFKGCGYADDWIALPDYLNDLNAMAEAETCEAIQRVGYAKYIECLAIACGTERLGALVFATSAQRAEAFLRTIGEWEE